MINLNKLVDRSKNKLDNVHPYVQNKAIELIKKAYAEGIYIQIAQGYRSIDEQNQLYAQGRTQAQLNTVGLKNVKAQPDKKIVTNAKGGQSIHNFGLAFDIVILNEDGSANWNTNDKKWQLVGQIGESIGLEWGGSWKTFKDMPHFEYTFGLTLKDLQNGKRPPEYKVTHQEISTVSSANTNNKLVFKDMEFKKGQIGVLTILKPINLWKRNEDKLEMVRILQPNEKYRVYGYDDKFGGQYNVGGGCWVTKMDGYIKYETPSKEFLTKAKEILK